MLAVFPPLRAASSDKMFVIETSLFSKIVIIRRFVKQTDIICSNNAINLRHLTSHNTPFAPQRRDHNVPTGCCDVTSLYVYDILV